MLHKELQWLVRCKHDCLDQNVPSVHDTVLEGHLLLIKALICTLSPQAKASLRTSNDGPPLIKVSVRKQNILQLTHRCAVSSA